MTLLEILVSLAIVGLLAFGLSAGIRRVRKTDLWSDASKLAAALRSAFDHASVSGAHHRVTIDFDKQTFRVERCEGQVRIQRTTDKLLEEQRAEVTSQLAALREQAAHGLTMQPTDPNAAPVETKKKAAACTPISGNAGKPQAFEKKHGITVRSVTVAHLQHSAFEGQVSIHFFPLGFSERAVIELSDDGDDKVSLLVHPASGRVQLVPGEYRQSGDFVTEDAEGNKVAP